MGVRAPLVRHRLGRRGQRDPAVHPRLLPPRVRPVHRDHDPQPEAGHEEEPQGSVAPREVPRGAVQDLLPTGLPQPACEVRAGVTRLRAPRGAARAAARWLRPHRQWGNFPPPGRNPRTSQPSGFVSLRSPLHEHHRALGGRLVDFAGWDMPLQFSGVVAEHTAVRERVGLFDVSHLGKLLVEGAGAIDALEWAVTNGVGSIPEWRARYNLVLTDTGGIVDDLFVYRRPDAWLVVPNAANVPAVLEAIRSAAWPLPLTAGEPYGLPPVGLGARDPLRLEMGSPLHGHEISVEPTPIEAGLGWTIDWSKKDFRGRAAVEAVRQAGPSRTLAGLAADGPGIPRAGQAVLRDGEAVGAVTSGNFSPTLRKGI